MIFSSLEEALINGIKKRFDSSKRKDFEEFIKYYAREIVDKWVNYFVWKKSIEPKIITRRIK